MDRHWFPAILLGCSVALALVFAVVLSPPGHGPVRRTPDVRQVTEPTATVTEDTYKSAVISLLNTYADQQDAKATYDALIAVTVPRTMLNLHYDLVVAFGKLVNGDESDGQARLAALKAQYPWLPL